MGADVLNGAEAVAAPQAKQRIARIDGDCSTSGVFPDLIYSVRLLGQTAQTSRASAAWFEFSIEVGRVKNGKLYFSGWSDRDCTAAETQAEKKIEDDERAIVHFFSSVKFHAICQAGL